MEEVKAEVLSPSRSSSTATGTPKSKKAGRRINKPAWSTKSKRTWFCFWCNASFNSKGQHLKSAPSQANRQGHSTAEELEEMEAAVKNGVLDEAYEVFLDATSFDNTANPNDRPDDPSSYVETSFRLVDDFILPQLDKSGAQVFIDLGSGTGHILSQVALKRQQLKVITGFEVDEVLLSLAENWRSRLRGLVGRDSYNVIKMDLTSPALENTIDPYGVHGVRKFVYCNNIRFPQSLNLDIATTLFPTLPDGSVFMTVKPLGTDNALQALLRPFECHLVDVPKTSNKNMFDATKTKRRHFYVYVML